MIWLPVPLLLLVFLAALAVRSFRAAPLPAPEPWSGPLPAASPPEGMQVFRLPTGTYSTPAVLAFRGGSPREKREFAATAVLVRHPSGDLLIDAGFGDDVEAHLGMLPSYRRTPHTFTRSVHLQLTDGGYDLARLLGVVVTHAHWDHVSGLAELPVPVWMNDAEGEYVVRASDASIFREVSRGHEIHRYAFDGPPHLGFPASHDVHGDGSVVIAPAGGHTDGSVVVFVTLPGDERFAFVGDLTWQLEGVTRRAERPALLRRLADVDAAQVRTGLLRVIALAGRMHVVPAHDTRAYAPIPEWGSPERS